MLKSHPSPLYFLLLNVGASILGNYLYIMLPKSPRVKKLVICPLGLGTVALALGDLHRRTPHQWPSQGSLPLGAIYSHHQSALDPLYN